MNTGQTTGVEALRDYATRVLQHARVEMAGQVGENTATFIAPTRASADAARTLETCARAARAELQPHKVIVRHDHDYLYRWKLEDGRHKPQMSYLHHITGDDDDHPHDHPWPSLGALISGTLIEQWWENGERACSEGPAASIKLLPGAWVYRPAHHVHRLVLPQGTQEAMTLFVRGAQCRRWGFWTPRGFVGWREYTEGLG